MPTIKLNDIKVDFNYHSQACLESLPEAFNSKGQNIEELIGESIKNNILRFLSNLHREVNAKTYSVSAALYEDCDCFQHGEFGDPDYEITYSKEYYNIRVHVYADTEKKGVEFLMHFNCPQKEYDYFNEDFINRQSIKDLKNLVSGINNKDEKEIYFTAKRMKDYEDFKKSYPRLKSSKLFYKTSFYYNYENEVHQFLSNFINARLKKFVSINYIKVSCIYLIGNTNQTQIALTKDWQLDMDRIFNLDFHETFNEKSENELLDYLLQEGFLNRDAIDTYKEQRNMNDLISISKLLDY